VYPLSGGNTGLHGCGEHALGVSGVVRKKFNGSRIVRKSLTPSVLCQDGTTTPGPYPKRFEPGNELLAPELLEICSVYKKVAFSITDEQPSLSPKLSEERYRAPLLVALRAVHTNYFQPLLPLSHLSHLASTFTSRQSHFMILKFYQHFSK